MAVSIALPYHPGELRMHSLLHVPPSDNPTASILTPQAIFMLQRAPLLAIGTLDTKSRPWTSLWGGRHGFSQSVGSGAIGTRTLVDGQHDPVVQALVGGATKGEMVEGKGKMLSALTMDLMTRKRVKIFGRMLAGCMGEVDVDASSELNGIGQGTSVKQDQIQLVAQIEQSLGNCPKYLNQWDISPAAVDAKLVYNGSELCAEGKDLIRRVDMFFMTTTTAEDMDTNHRGGPLGFVRILSDREIVYPEYSGNRLYQSLGNLQTNPNVGVTFASFEKGDVLYITGVADVLVGGDAAKMIPGSNLAVKITVSEAHYVRSGLPLRGTRKTPSPYNPIGRTLATEGNVRSALSGSPSSASTSVRKTAVLTKKVLITPNIARFTFSVNDGIGYTAGQWVAFDFSHHFDQGYSHMRDEDPRSLNDDFVRTFTISSRPQNRSDGGRKSVEAEAIEGIRQAQKLDRSFEVTMRKVGVVTDWLFQQSVEKKLEIPIIGVGGEFCIPVGPTQVSDKKSIATEEISKGAADTSTSTVFLAAGIGITPLLSQLSLLDTALDSPPDPSTASITSTARRKGKTGFELLWTLPVADANLVLDTLASNPHLRYHARVYFTQAYIEVSGEQQNVVDKVRDFLGEDRVYMRRITEDDVKTIRNENAENVTWYVCVGKRFGEHVIQWLDGEKVVSEGFDY